MTICHLKRGDRVKQKRSKYDNTERPRPREYWRPVPGYDGMYQCSTEGRIRRDVNGNWEIIQPLENASGRKAYYTVWMKRPDGEWEEKSLLRIVARTWYPDRMRPGLDVMHLNGLHSDNSAYNIRFVSRAERMRIQTAGHTRRATVRLDETGKVINVYASMQAAADATGWCYATIRRHCHGGCKRLLPDRTTFRFDSEDMTRKRR